MGQQRQVTTRYRRRDLSRPVEGMRNTVIVELCSLQCQSKGPDKRPFRPSIIECRSHRRMKGSDFEARLQMRMKQRDVTIAGNPFRVFTEAREVDVVDYPGEAIPATATKNGIDLRVVKHPLEVRQSLTIGPGKIVFGTATE